MISSVLLHNFTNVNSQIPMLENRYVPRIRLRVKKFRKHTYYMHYMYLLCRVVVHLTHSLFPFSILIEMSPNRTYFV